MSTSPKAFPLAKSCTFTSFGRIPSWLLLSFQIFATVLLISSTACVFVKIKFPSLSLSILLSYPEIVSSSFIVYSISFPDSYFGRSFQVALQLLFSFIVSTSPKAFPLAKSCTFTSFGRIPSWLLLSFQTFVTFFSMVLCVFLIIIDISFSLTTFSYVALYPSIACSSTS